MKLGANRKTGYLTTPALDLSNSGGTVIVTFSAMSYGNDASSIVVSCGDVSETVELADTAAEYTVMFMTAPAEAGQTVTLSCTGNGKRFYLYSVTIISGEELASKAVAETGDADSRVITGITDQYYVVEGLTPGATYEYYVKAIYIDESEAQSNVETVTLLEEQGHGYNVGDVNHDGSLTVADVTMLISYVLAQSGPACPVCADVNGDGNIAVADVTLLISMVLSGAN